MSEIDSGGPAFPSEQGETSKGWNQTYEAGLTKREWFAGMALQGLLSGNPNMSLEESTKWAYDHADSVLRAGKGVGK